jgi:PIN domain nuclease of toxin-antitoxin system
MRLLLDTHVLLWCLTDDPTLSSSLRDVITDGSNDVLVSAASAWEIAIKKALGKLEAPDDLSNAIAVCRFKTLPVTVTHAMHAGALPKHHNDPFDRMLVAQSILEDLMLVTRDARIVAYEVSVMPA